MKKLARVICGAALFLGGMLGISACLIAGAIADLGISTVVWVVLAVVTLLGLVFMLVGCSGTEEPVKGLFLPPEQETANQKQP